MAEEAFTTISLQFNCRCRRLPKGLHHWQAFSDLKKGIEDFIECCSLLEMMSDKAMKQRHWDRIAETTGHQFDIESETFCLRNIMEAPILQNKEDIEVHFSPPCSFYTVIKNNAIAYKMVTLLKNNYFIEVLDSQSDHTSLKQFVFYLEALIYVSNDRGSS